MGDWKKAGSGSKTDRTWDATTEETIQGVYVEKKDITKKDGKQTTMFVLKEKDGKLVGIWTTAVLTSRFAEIPLGYEVMIKYLGKEVSKKSGNSVKNYDVSYRPVDETGEASTAEDDDIPF